MNPSLYINKVLATPVYLQLKQELLRQIEQGILLVGTALPSERELAEHLGLSRMTVRRCYQTLVEQNILEQRKGSGTYIANKHVRQTIDHVIGFSEEIKNLGFKAGSKILSFSSSPCDANVANHLNIQPGQTILILARLRTAQDEPLALQTAYLAPELLRLSHSALRRNHSLYQTIKKQFGLSPYRAKQTVVARMPTSEEARHLRIEVNTPVLALERTTFDVSGKPFEYVRSSYRGDRYQMILDLRAP